MLGLTHQHYLNPAVDLNLIEKKEGASTLTVDANGVLRAVSNATGTGTSGWGFYNLYVPGGGLVEVVFEGKQNAAGSKGRAGIDAREDNAAVGGYNIDYMEMVDTTWRPYKMTQVIAPDRPYVNFSFGIWASLTGDASFRNIQIRVYNGHNLGLGVRACMIKASAGAFTIDDATGRFTNLGVESISIGTDYITINYDKIQAFKRPIAIAHMDNYGNATGYDAKAGGADLEGCNIRFYNAAGAIVPPSEIASATRYINLLLIAL